MVRLYKFDASPVSRACLMACELFNVPVEMVDVKVIEGKHMTLDFMKKNPLHTVPILEDGSLVIQDSHAILMYLADVYGKQDSYYPKDPKQRVFVNQKLFFNSTIFVPENAIHYEGNKEIPEKGFDAIEEAYSFLEEFLSRCRFLAGDYITIADIVAYATVTSMVLLLDLNAQKYLKTRLWLLELEKQPYVLKGNAKGINDMKHLVNLKRG